MGGRRIAQACGYSRRSFLQRGHVHARRWSVGHAGHNAKALLSNAQEHRACEHADAGHAPAMRSSTRYQSMYADGIARRCARACTGPVSCAGISKSGSLRLASSGGSAWRAGCGVKVMNRRRMSSGSLLSLRLAMLMVTHVLVALPHGLTAAGAAGAACPLPLTPLLAALAAAELTEVSTQSRRAARRPSSAK